jgi:hypothetical protein
LKSPYQITPQYQISKVLLVLPLAGNVCQNWTFSVQILMAPCCCPPFPAGKCIFPVRPPSSNENVNFANDQTYRIPVPYCQRSIETSMQLLCGIAFSSIQVFSICINASAVAFDHLLLYFVLSHSVCLYVSSSSLSVTE